MNRFFLVKITKLEYAKSLQDGKVFFGTVSNFADLEKRGAEMNNVFRGDTLEGLTAILIKITLILFLKRLSVLTYGEKLR